MKKSTPAVKPAKPRPKPTPQAVAAANKASTARSQAAKEKLKSKLKNPDRDPIIDQFFGEGPTAPGRVSRISDLERKQLAAAADGITPLEFAASVLRDRDAPMSHKQWATETLMPYMHRKLPTQVIVEGGDKPVKLFDATQLKDIPVERLAELGETLKKLGISIL